MSDSADILIVGGGVVGLTTAWFLSGEGASVLVVEQGDVGKQASWAGAGIIPPGDPRRAHSPLDLLRAHSSVMYPVLSAQLLEETGIDNSYVVCGGIELPDPDAPGCEPPTEEWHAEGVSFQVLDRAGLVKLQPDLGELFDRGAWLPHMAQVRNPRHLKALRAGCSRRGVRFETGWPVRELHLQGNRVAGVEGERGRLPAGKVLLAAGAWTESLLGDLGFSPGIKPIRGQIALLDTGTPGVRPLLLQGKRYLVPRLDGKILAGSTEEDVGFDARATEEGIRGLLSFAFRLLPSLRAARLEAKWAGLRPGSPDGVPFMGLVPGWKNLHVSAGHFRAGLQLSPASGLVMAQQILGQAPLIPLEAFRLDRPVPPWSAAPPPRQTAFRS
jgi:glycine oxidase